MTRPLCRTGIASLCLVFALRSAAAEVGAGLSLRIRDEAAAAGSIVQIKIDVTEPKPISTGRGKAKIKGITTVEGIVLMNEGQDTYGLALVDSDGEGNELTFNIVSPSSRFGTAADYPILGIAGRVSASPLGATFPLTLDASALGFRDPSGALYPTEIQDGKLTVANGVTIGDVSPGSSLVPAGGVVHIRGANFTPSTRLQLSETSVAEQRYIDSGHIDVVLGQPTNMHGLRIRARNDVKGGDRSESEYFSYERTTADGASNDSLFRKVVPLFAPTTYTAATVDLPRTASSSGRRRAAAPSHGSGNAGSSVPAGLALQNLNASPASVSIELLDGRGNPYAINTVTVGPDRYLVRELGEVFGSVVPPSAFRIRSSLPIHVLGLIGERSGGTAAALPPH